MNLSEDTPSRTSSFAWHCPVQAIPKKIIARSTVAGLKRPHCGTYERAPISRSVRTSLRRDDPECFFYFSKLVEP